MDGRFRGHDGMARVGAMMHMLRQAVGNLRSLLALGVVSSVNDSGQAQTANLSTGTDVNRADVEVAWPFGFSSVPPADGAIGIVIQIGGDAGNLMVLPLGNPSARFGGLAAGEAVIYAGDGTRVKVRPGAVEIWGANVTVNATNIALDGNVTVNGNLATTGTLSDSHGSLDRLRGHYNQHVGHGTGGATPSAPDPE